MTTLVPERSPFAWAALIAALIPILTAVIGWLWLGKVMPEHPEDGVPTVAFLVFLPVIAVVLAMSVTAVVGLPLAVQSFRRRERRRTVAGGAAILHTAYVAAVCWVVSHVLFFR